MERIPAASAMDWSIDLDRGLRSRHHATRVHALDAAGPRLRQLCTSPIVPAPVSSAFGVLPGEARLFAETILLRLATEFRTADSALRARIVRTLLAAGGRGALAGARVAEPDQLLRRVKAVYDTGSARDRALALRVFGCLADIAKDSVHVRSLILSSLGATSALEVKAALLAAGCICRLSEDFSCIILEVLRRLICSRRSKPQVILAAIKAFPKLDCTLAVIHRVHEVGKQMVLGTLEDVFKAEMLSSLSRLASKSIILFSDQVELLLLFLGDDSSPSMKSMALKYLCIMFRRNTCHFPVIRTVFVRLLPLIDDEDFPLHCKSDVLRILQKVFCGKAPSIHHDNGSELSKLILAAENSLHSSSLEMQGTALEILVEVLCFLKQARPDLTVTTLKGSSFAYSECQGITNMSLIYEENGKDSPLYRIITAIMDHSISLINKVISKESKKVTSRNICISSELNKKYKALFSLMLKLVTCYPSAAAVALDKLKCLVKELAQINDSDYSEVVVTCAESFQTSVAVAELSASNDNVELLATSIEPSLVETDIWKAKLDSTEFDSKKSESLTHDLILSTLKSANSCYDMLCKTSDARCDLHDCIKGLIECVHQNASQYWSTYETFRMIMCACIAWNTCKIRDSNQESGDSKEEPNILFTPSVWIAQELCALRMTKMLITKQKYWEAYRSSMYCCREGLWFTASFVFRKLADAFELGSFSFWFKSLLLFSAGEIEMKLLLFPSATVKLVGELKTDGDLSEDLYCTETDADNTPSGSQELHGYQAKITGICGRTWLANDALVSNASSDCEFFFQRWFISLRSSFLEVLTDVLGILSAHSSAYEARGDNLTVSGELIKDQVLALAHCSLRLSDLAKSYDILAASHMDMDHHSFSSIARLAFMCSLFAFCTAYSVDFSKAYRNVEPFKLPKRFSHASILQDLHGRLDGSGRQIVSQLRQFMSTSFDDLDCLQSSARMSCSGLQFLSSILQKFMELPFVVPKYFFRVRPCLGAELYMFDSNPANKHEISVEPGFHLSLTLCMQWKRVLERNVIRLVKFYCILAANSESCIDVAGTRSKQFEPHKITEMVELNTKLLHYIKNDLRKSWDEKNFHSSTNMVTAFACFEPTDSGQGLSSCLLNVSSFPEGSYQIKWHACCVDENGSYFVLPPLNDGVVFSVRKS
ncbi:uncharacterized protein LOC133908584 isoform X2 [Phragmites australis]|uniref:uncharacterized protein LOC133908584 isoform X2 n=1 Tax=Phragmites australis TaxID=29695 RepID=UPI002D789B23|nr:uncharacterized protein LOC133908584 isoform X2 [Phragmites australis]